jgi:hypothetical protein
MLKCNNGIRRRASSYVYLHYWLLLKEVPRWWNSLVEV